MYDNKTKEEFNLKLNQNYFFGKRNIRTDLAIEAFEIAEEEQDISEIDGVTMQIEEDEKENIRVTWVKVLNEMGCEKMGRPIGNYITIESESMKTNDILVHEEIIKVFSKKLSKLHDLKKDSKILIVGLGNWNVTPDALGPKVVSKVLVTRHIKESLPDNIINNVRSVSAISPGVMGITGIETVEIVKGIVDKIKPDLVIAIDALASRKTSRINSTIQMSDTGISPGAGMGNKRMTLDKNSLGVKVIAIGVPTVVDAATLVNDTMDMILSSMKNQIDEGSEFYEMLESLEQDEKYNLIKKILDPYSGNMFVTPKEVDEVIERLSNIIANGINISLHPGIDSTDINRYIN